jgi:short-subunit dehydrogenase
VYISSRDAKACEATAAGLTKSGPGECIAIPGDLAKFEECVKLVKEIEKREKVLHVLVSLLSSGSGHWPLAAGANLDWLEPGTTNADPCR